MSGPRANRAIRGELHRLVALGLLRFDQLPALAARYPVGTWDVGALIRWFTVLGAVSFGAGLLILVPRFVKLQNAIDVGLGLDDQVTVELDPFRSFNAAATSKFSVNARGTQSDEIGGGRARQLSWKGDWKASTARARARTWRSSPMRSARAALPSSRRASRAARPPRSGCASSCWQRRCDPTARRC